MVEGAWACEKSRIGIEANELGDTVDSVYADEYLFLWIGLGAFQALVVPFSMSVAPDILLKTHVPSGEFTLSRQSRL